MKFGFNNHIRVLFDSPRATESTQSKQAEVGKNKTLESRDVIDTKKLDTLTKELLEGYIKEPSRQKAVNLLTSYLQQKEKELQNNPTLLKSLKEKAENIKILSNYDGYLFGSSPEGNKKEIPADKQKSIKDFLQISHVTIDFSRAKNFQDIKEVPIINKESQEFINKYPLNKFKDTVYEKAVKHPIISKNWTFLNEYKDIKTKVQKLDNKLPPEYRIVVGTIDKIMQSKEFADNTGKIDTFIQTVSGHKQDVKTFQDNMRRFLDIATQKQKILGIEEFKEFFNEQRSLTPKEKEENDKFAQEVTYKVNILGTKQEKLALIDKIISEENSLQIYSKKQQNDRLSYLHNIRSEKDRGQNDDIIGFIGQSLRNIKSSNKLEDVEKEAEKMRQTTRIPHFVDYDTLLKKYVIISSTDIARELLKPNLGKIDRTLFQSLLKAPNWEIFIKEAIGTEGIAAVGLYLKKQPDTQLFQGIESGKSFFLSSYNQFVQHQNSLLENKKEVLSGKFDLLFPNLMKLPEIKDNPIIQQKIKEKNIGGAYDILAGKISNGRMAEIMSILEEDAKNLESEGSKKLIIESVKWKGKTIKDANIKVNSEEDQKTLEKISKKSISNGTLDEQDISFLLRVLPHGHELRLFIELYNQIKFGGKIAAEANVGKIIAKKGKPTDTSTVLSKGQNEALRTTGNLRYADSMNKIGQKLFTMNADPTNAEQKKQFVDNKAKYDRIIAISTAALANNQELTNDDRRAIIRTNIDSKLTDKEIDRFIDTQVFISKYVEEKNFVDIVEKNAAYMNIGETKSIGNLYGFNKINIEEMTTKSGSVSIGETSLLGNNTLTGMDELMQCRVEIGSGLFTRTIRDPNGEIIKRNLPLENIEATIDQLGRFYSLGLGILAPYMEKVNTSINSCRSDKITGFDGKYKINEDIHFLKILTIMLYGPESLPKELNIPNLIQRFNRVERENHPEFILKQNGILTGSGSINLALLEKDLEKSSKLVS